MIPREELIKLWGGEPTPDEQAAFLEFARSYSLSEDEYLQYYNDWLESDDRAQSVRALEYHHPTTCDWTCEPAGTGTEEGTEFVSYVTVAEDNRTWKMSWTELPDGRLVGYTNSRVFVGVRFGRGVEPIV